MDNIGARRLHTIMERILEDISFEAPDKVRYSVCLHPGHSAAPVLSKLLKCQSIFLMLQLQEAQAAGQQGYKYVVDKDDVKRRVEDLLKKQDLSKFVL